MRLLAGTMVCIACAAPAGSQDLRSPYLRAQFDGARLTTLCVDPDGRSQYGGPVFRDMHFGAAQSLQQAGHSQDTLVFRGDVFKSVMDGRSDGNNPYLLQPGHSLGVVFNAAVEFTAAGLRMPTYNGRNAGATLRLWKAESTGTPPRKVSLAAEDRISDHKDNAWAELQFEPLPPGTYYLEATDPEQEIGVWGDTRGEPSGDSYGDGVPLAANLNYRYQGRKPVACSVTWKLSGRTLSVQFVPVTGGMPFPGCTFTSDWRKDGYEIRPFPFDAVSTTSGQWIYFNQVKRRPHSQALLPCSQALLRGESADIAVTFDPAGTFGWFAEADSLSWRGGSARMSFEVRRSTDEIPSWAPVFECSDEQIGRLSTEFYLSHGANFGVGTNPDWKEWQGQILSWTANPMNETVKRQLADGFRMTPEGYVYTWGSEQGWPFPVEDINEDGVNDYDTRHFTTNACFVLGIWRLLSWTRDDSFARETLPRARRAMDYQLHQLQGEDGVIVTNAAGHSGKHDGIGSNYWDILPFGHLDAYSSIYFAASLDAMAELEQYASGHGISADGTTRTPAVYRRLARKARVAYRGCFWDCDTKRFVGCVDEGGFRHDYGFTFVNVEAAGYAIPTQAQAEALYRWLDTGVTSSGQADIYSRWQFAPRSLTVHNPRRDEPQTPVPSWWFFGWPGTDYDGQCQNGGAILYTSFYDILGRIRYLGAENALERYRAILNRYAEPDRLSGGSPLYHGEKSQGGPDGGAGSAGVEGEFPESGLVPCILLHGFMGVRPTASGLVVSPALPHTIEWLRCRNVCFAGTLYTIHTTATHVSLTRQRDGKRVTKSVVRGEARFVPDGEEWR